MDKEVQMTLRKWFITFSFIFLNACTTIPVDQRQEIRDEVDLAAGRFGMAPDINKRLSWAAEYDGFTGSRDAFITQISWKY